MTDHESPNEATVVPPIPSAKTLRNRKKKARAKANKASQKASVHTTTTTTTTSSSSSNPGSNASIIDIDSAPIHPPTSPSSDPPSKPTSSSQLDSLESQLPRRTADVTASQRHESESHRASHPCSALNQMDYYAHDYCYDAPYFTVPVQWNDWTQKRAHSQWEKDTRRSFFSECSTAVLTTDLRYSERSSGRDAWTEYYFGRGSEKERGG
ncbi:hypothetical protein CC2G_012170 [Coprinopsis cinerea AmutBmut pab1-1]|nr:hypothetical protein CC2G_012170 [Coprinopsis cinerea AmutBmut pab1-1]